MADKIYKFGHFILNGTKRELRVDISGRPMDLLLFLVSKRGIAFPREDLIKEVWKRKVEDNALSQQLKTLRGLLHDDWQNPSFIETTGDGHVKFIGIVIEAGNAPPGEPTDPPQSDIVAPTAEAKAPQLTPVFPAEVKSAPKPTSPEQSTRLPEVRRLQLQASTIPVKSTWLSPLGRLLKKHYGLTDYMAQEQELLLWSAFLIVAVVVFVLFKTGALRLGPR